MKTVLLTGSAGFVGHKTADCLMWDGYRVIGVENINEDYDLKLKEHYLLKEKPKFELHKIDINN